MIRFGQDSYDDFNKIFVVGEPRSGTTLLHALCCTSDDCNNYLAECSYFTGLIKNLITGYVNLSAHNNDFFGSEEAYLAYNRNMLKRFLIDTWHSVGTPKNLILKDPIMTQYIHEVLQILDGTKFLVSVRNPRDTFKSFLKVLKNEKVEASESVVRRLADEYVSHYSVCLEMSGLYEGRVHFCCYENLLNQKDKSRLAETLGIKEIVESKLWEPARKNIARFPENNPWVSVKYGKPISKEKINEDINIETWASIIEPCNEIYNALRGRSLI